MQIVEKNCIAKDMVLFIIRKIEEKLIRNFVTEKIFHIIDVLIMFLNNPRE